ncbi:carotenoid biosynthesis protein [Parasporobacterium paucivorans]|uniref:Carotenoid biosynthesis protein n=1 Tax=Parasporobacterium paucivorans DSM 15970 TaxID=1122934 RepID=A0A1M6KTQ8_9FIRM|nr:carotenoid biosynthesis protein [Parasporobacterium paucivorans]SHJ62323.1 Protein of unknown function [Parasporobacterium paucivorans DSM 15970]
MTWMNWYEIICYLLVAIFLFDSIKRKDKKSLYAFGSAALVGFTLELFSVNFTGGYYYNNDFLMVIGSKPHHFPIFGGLMWGALASYSIRIAKKFKFNKLITSFFAGMLIVSWDIILDVIAIRLEFWTWVGKTIDLTVTNYSFMGVSWGNFLGYMIMVPGVSYFILRTQEHVDENDTKKQLLHMIINWLIGAVIAIGGTLLAILLNKVTCSLSSMILFLLVWVVMVVIIAKKVITSKIRIAKKKDYPIMIFWLGNYVFVLYALLYLNIQATHLWLLIVGIAFMLITILFCLLEPLTDN